MSNILSHRLFRIYDWWEYKIPQILIPIYLIILNSENLTNSFIDTKIFSVLVLGIILGALTVSIIGEYFDITQDKLAGKTNGFDTFNQTQSISILIITLLVNTIFLFFLKTDSLIFYLLSILTFFFYYVPFIRLKEKGFWGVLSDSLGSHVFPATFVFTCLISVEKILKFEYIIFLIWLLFFGIRGILNHQYTDLENDKKSKTKTFVKTSSEKNKNILKKFLLIMEIISFITLLIATAPISLISSAVLLYLLILFGRKMLFNNALVYFNIKKDRSYSIFLFEFYTVFFPFLLIIQIYEINQISFWVLFFFHIFITLKRIIKILKELKESINFILQ